MPVNPALVESMSGERRIGASHFENRVIPTIDPMNPSREELHSRAEPPSCDLHAILCHVPETDACDARRVDEQSATLGKDRRGGAKSPGSKRQGVDARRKWVGKFLQAGEHRLRRRCTLQVSERKIERSLVFPNIPGENELCPAAALNAA